MEPTESPKLRHPRNRRRRLVRAQQLQEKPLTMMVGSGEDDEDEDGEFESPPRTSKEDNNNKGRSKPPPPRRRRSRTSSNSFDEDIIDGFAIISFKTLEDLEVSTCYTHILKIIHPPLIKNKKNDTSFRVVDVVKYTPPGFNLERIKRNKVCIINLRILLFDLIDLRSNSIR